MAPTLERSLTTMAVVPCAPFQPRTMPSSLSKRNSALPPVGSANPAVGLKTVPVGPPATETTRPCFTPAPLYSVDLSVPLSDTHHGLVALEGSPHGLPRSGPVAGGTA